jgi:hypothetical protein
MLDSRKHHKPKFTRTQLEGRDKSTKLLLEDKANQLTRAGKNSLKGKKIHKRLERERLVVVEANFGKQSHKIIEMLEMEDADGAITLLKKRLLQTTIDLIPLAEQNIRDTDGAKGVYQFSTLVNQAREIMVDIQADYDKMLLAQIIEEKVIRPVFMDIAQELITEHHDFKKRVADMIHPADTQAFSTELKDLATLLARKMTSKFMEVRLGLQTSLKG